MQPRAARSQWTKRWRCSGFMIRNLNISALFEPGVPGNTHAHELGKFFSSESWRVSLWNCWEAKLFGTQARATRAQKSGESCMGLHAFGHLFLIISHRKRLLF